MYLQRGGPDSLLSRLGYIFSLLLLIGILHQNVVLGSHLTKRDDDEPDDPDSDVDSPGSSPPSPLPDKYPDLDDCRQKVSVAKDKSVFYSGVGDHEDKPQKFADQLPKGALLRDAYPGSFIAKNDDWTGYKAFLKLASQALAEKSSGVVYVVLPTDNTDISKKVWTKDEKPALISNKDVVRIVKVDPNDFTKKCVLWGAADSNLSSCNAENGPVPGKSSSSSSSSSTGQLQPSRQQTLESTSLTHPHTTTSTSPSTTLRTSRSTAKSPSTTPRTRRS